MSRARPPITDGIVASAIGETGHPVLKGGGGLLGSPVGADFDEQAMGRVKCSDSGVGVTEGLGEVGSGPVDPRGKGSDAERLDDGLGLLQLRCGDLRLPWEGLGQNRPGQLETGQRLVVPCPAADGDGDGLGGVGLGGPKVPLADLGPGSGCQQHGRLGNRQPAAAEDLKGLVGRGDCRLPFGSLSVADGQPLTGLDLQERPASLVGQGNSLAGVAEGGP